MKRRTFITALFATAAVAIVEPAQAIGRRRGRRFKGFRSGGRIRSFSRRVTSQNVSYPGRSRRMVQSRVMGEIPAEQVGRAPQPRISLSNQYIETLSDSSGRLTEAQVYRFREKYASGQSREAMRSALGEPAQHTLFKDRWRIKRTDIYGNPAPDSWFEADYGWNAPTQGLKAKTVKPPIAHW